jgi:BirA family transcriptional regulator, biotin operon repressor / biotin---[acetyl-CoA-carboxylase] ligase
MPEPTRTSEVGRWRVERFEELASTNGYALAAARAGAADGLVVVADHQTAGRGRLDRRWEAPPGSSLLVSVLVRRPPADDAFALVMAAAVALAEAVEEVTGVKAGLKWPNDLVVADRKLAGLLAERDGDALVVGSGCNTNWDAFPAELADTATACNLEAGHDVDRDALLDAYLVTFAGYLDAPEIVADAYRRGLVTLGRQVRVERTAQSPLVGEAVRVDDAGALVVRDAEDIEHVILAGDVVHLRGMT